LAVAGLAAHRSRCRNALGDVELSINAELVLVSITGGLTLDEGCFPPGDDFRGLRVHQVRLQGGDASSDSYCYR
jgi:hypothetical protein